MLYQIQHTQLRHHRVQVLFFLLSLRVVGEGGLVGHPQVLPEDQVVAGMGGMLLRVAVGYLDKVLLVVMVLARRTTLLAAAAAQELLASMV